MNPGAGSADEVREAVARSGQFDLRETPPDRMTQAAKAAIEKGARRIAAIGGDGTVSAIAAATARTDTELVVIPGGTFNHFARDNGIPTDLDEACAVAASQRVIEADVAWVNGRMFLNTSSVGVYANYVRVRERWEPKFGYWLSTIISVVRTFARVRPFRLEFESDSVDRTYQTPLVFIGLGERELKLPKLGGRVEGGRPGMHVLIVRGRTRARLLALAFAAAARGVRALSRTPHLDTFMLTKCIIEQRHSTVAVDGEIVKLDSPLHYEFGRGALKLVVPPLGAEPGKPQSRSSA